MTDTDTDTSFFQNFTQYCDVRNIIYFILDIFRHFRFVHSEILSLYSDSAVTVTALNR